MRRGFLSLGLVALALPAFAGGAMQSLRSAAADPAGGSLESQSARAGSSFTGGASPIGSFAVKTGGEGSLKPFVPSGQSASGPHRSVEPPLTDKQKGQLKLLRAGGIAAAVGGLGWIAAALALGAAFPIGGAALLFLGGMAAYWAHNRLKGKDILK